MAETYARLIQGLPNVANAADRAARYPTPDTYQKVFRVDSYAVEMWDGSSWVEVIPGGIPVDLLWSGTGSPEGVVTAAVGSIYLQTDGLDGATLWLKTSGVGNTGWVVLHANALTNIYNGTGSPEGVVTAAVSSIYLQTDGALGNVLWLKSTGSGNTGWELLNVAALANTFQGNGSPEGVVDGVVSAVYRQLDGGDGVVGWIKNSGTGNTGWRPVQTHLGTYNVVDYGATGDGVTDDTDAINDAIIAANAAGGGTVWFPEGVYMIDADYNGGAGIRLLSNVTLQGDGAAEVKAIPNNLTHYGVITALGTLGNPRRKIAIRNLRVTGERSGHIGVTGEFGHGIQLYGAVDVWIEDCYVKDCWGDGYYIGSAFTGAEPCQNVFLDNCVGYNNRRNNYSIVGCLGGGMVNCGGLAANGTAPQAGVDVEPDYADNVEDFTVDSCYFYDNVGYGIVTTANAKGVRIVNNGVRRTGAASAGYSIAVGSIDTLVANNIVSEVTHGTRGAIDVGSTAVRAVIANNILRDIETGANRAGIYVHGSATDIVVRGNHITKYNTAVAGGGVINAQAAKTQVCGNFIRDSLDIGIAVATGADCHIVGNTIDSVANRGMYIDAARPVILGNTIRDVSSVTNGMVQLTATCTSAVMVGNMAVLTTPNTAIVPYYVLVAPAVAYGNGYSGTKTHTLSYVSQTISADKGDAGATFTCLPDGDEDVIVAATPLTGTRTVTLSTTRAYAGCRRRFVRTAAATGASAWSIGGLINLAVGEWAEVEYSAAGAWILVGAGLLSATAGVYAPLASPTFTGTPTLPTGTIAVTQNGNTNNTTVATTAYVDRATTHTNTTSASPTGTSSLTAVMMGLAGSITPTRGTKIIIVIAGQMSNNTINDGSTVDIRYGTGSAPTNGAAVTGTLAGIAQTYTSSAANERDGFAQVAKVTGLTINTAYWIDLSLMAVTGGTSSLTGVSIVAFEVP